MSKVEELRESIIAMAIEPTARAEVTFNLDSLIAAARQEGAEQERERMRNANGVLKLKNNEAQSVWITAGEYFILPVSVLSPTEPDTNVTMTIHGKTRGEPSQALLDELSEIAGEKVEFVPTEPEVKP